MKDKIILYGGSFDPIHNGHIEIAKTATSFLNANLVFVPAKNARWKENSASPEDRLRMVNIAINELNKEDNRYSVSGFEICQKGDGPSYSIDTVEYFSKKHNCLYFLIGADQVNQFHMWKDAEKISKLAKIVYVGRPDFELNESNIKKYAMSCIPFKERRVSSTDIRMYRSIDYPDSIRKYVETRKLYFFRDLLGFLKPTRLEHSISVANVALNIVRSNPGIVDELLAYQAGVFHDLGKYLPEKESREIIKKEFSLEYSKYPIWALHQWTGSYIAKEQFGIENKAVLDAIQYHCTGRPGMNPLEQIIYSSDKIDPLRGYNSKPLIDSCMADYHQGFLDVLRANRDFLGKKKEKKPYRDDALTQNCYKYFLTERKDQ